VALIIRHARLRSVTLPVPNLPRPGRRAFSLTLGLTSLLLLVDAVLHPHTIVDLWTLRQIQRLITLDLPWVTSTIGGVPSLLWLVMIGALASVSAGLGLRGRKIWQKTDVVDGRDEGATRTAAEEGPASEPAGSDCPCDRLDANVPLPFPTPLHRQLMPTRAFPDCPCRAA